ncbi:hypothetical protein [Sphingobium sp. CFD-2]|uniref:hypothetical protein n=1 Tax=Sphingobium sp. CFD-2 TaxID=2878542 RepID=UPI00214B9FC0|nr:hypothetical protein [Sphingobium sp. CFD-2]
MEDVKTKYRAGSVEWVDALRKYFVSVVEKQKPDFDLVFSIEVTNPPEELLRGDGRDTIGYVVSVQNGSIHVLDGPHHVSDAVMTTIDYDIWEPSLRQKSTEYRRWLAEAKPGHVKEGKWKSVGDIARVLPLAHMCNIIDDFYSEVTL